MSTWCMFVYISIYNQDPGARGLRAWTCLPAGCRGVLGILGRRFGRSLASSAFVLQSRGWFCCSCCLLWCFLVAQGSLRTFKNHKKRCIVVNFQGFAKSVKVILRAHFWEPLGSLFRWFRAPWDSLGALECHLGAHRGPKVEKKNENLRSAIYPGALGAQNDAQGRPRPLKWSPGAPKTIRKSLNN